MMDLVDDAWFTVETVDNRTYAISEYGHWEKVHSFLLIGEDKTVLIDTGLGIDNIKRIADKLTRLPIVVITTPVHWDPAMANSIAFWYTKPNATGGSTAFRGCRSRSPVKM